MKKTTRTRSSIENSRCLLIIGVRPAWERERSFIKSEVGRGPQFAMTARDASN
jgi:hypothetical protein